MCLFLSLEAADLNYIQAALSETFALYGGCVAAGSVEKLKQKPEHQPPANDKYVEMTELVELGMVIYTSQFPIVYVDSYLEVMKVLKRALKWNERAIELSVGKPHVIGEYEITGKALHSMLRTVESSIGHDATFINIEVKFECQHID